ncbi:hypothetical protein FO440_22425 [Mucilaginibacter corticis]|uniref:ATP-binding protein n=1 Tax=Mucilaginibacter corticis TaxID=2597670 RepID=A0A556M9Q7_9SPHI|nr:hypothetical protein [Mucilaginibacter corticis]TSJ36586.1 hypothetical protein FO440_22425 [Mucilaginibacter corticis]
MSIAQEIHIFKTHQQYLRSTNLERDWHDPEALNNYLVTPQSEQSLHKILAGLKPQSSLRAWRITGDYGSGKSSFALFAANVLDKRDLPGHIKVSNYGAEGARIIPLLITGYRGSLGQAILQSMVTYLTEKSKGESLLKEVEHILTETAKPDDSVVLKMTKRFHDFIIKSKTGFGISIFIDEAGKFLELAASKPEQEDIFLLQSLAEMAARSGKHPIIVVTILHQGLNAYSERLAKSQQREWEKVAGRFEEILWHHPLDQVVLLIGHALDVDSEAIPSNSGEFMTVLMHKALTLGWYGYTVSSDLLEELAKRLYPLHPTVIPILVKLFTTFGQNERSLYSFLLGQESFGLQDFVQRTEGMRLYRLHDLYDFARAAFGTKLAALSYHWKAVNDVIATFPYSNEEQLQLLKTIGLINLINSDALIASEALLSLANDSDMREVLDKLNRDNIIHFRGHAGGYCIWPHSSVNIEDCYAQAIAAVGPQTNDLKSLLKDRLSTRPIVARRHYIETGNLRYFGIDYIDASELESSLNRPFDSDGLILVPLCETEQQVQLAISIIEAAADNMPPSVIVVIPGQLRFLSEFLEEVRRWEWVERSVGDLRHDKYARDEVSRQLAISNLELQKQLQRIIGFNSLSADSALAWYHLGQKKEALIGNRAMMGFLADVFDELFPYAPRIHNELVNRRDISSAAASARLRLCERLFEYSDKPFLGMDPEKHPPEMSMYLSVFHAAGFHHEAGNGNWQIRLPDEAYDLDNCNVIPAMQRINELLNDQHNQRVEVPDIFEVLRSKPFGVRDGMIPVLLAVFIVMNEQAVALYEDGSFIPRITGSNYLRLIKAPETFQIQFYPITTLRTSLFSKLAQDLGFVNEVVDQVDLLDIIKPLYTFMGKLPEYVLNSNSLNSITQRVRNILRKTGDPVNLLFTDLPEACDIGDLKNASLQPEVIAEFSKKLKEAIDELRQSYPALLHRLLEDLMKEFELTGSFEKNRLALSKRATSVLPFITEIRLKSYCLRLADLNLNADQWAESLANLLCSMPANKWREKDIYKFEQELHHLTQQFIRVEATVYSKSKKDGEGISLRVALTRPDGQERGQVIHFSTSEAEVIDGLEKKISDLLEQYGQLGMAAASNALWKMLDDAQNKKNQN